VKFSEALRRVQNELPMIGWTFEMLKSPLRRLSVRLLCWNGHHSWTPDGHRHLDVNGLSMGHWRRYQCRRCKNFIYACWDLDNRNVKG